MLGSRSNYYITIKSFENGRIVFDGRCDRIDDQALAIIDRRSPLEPGDVMFTSIEPVGVTYLIYEKPTNWNINESVFTIRPKRSTVTPEYLYLPLRHSIWGHSGSTRHRAVSQRDQTWRSSTFRTPHPGARIVEEFSKIVSPALRQMRNLETQNTRLAELRDWLLPMLMNGQVTVE